MASLSFANAFRGAMQGTNQVKASRLEMMLKELMAQQALQREKELIEFRDKVAADRAASDQEIADSRMLEELRARLSGNPRANKLAMKRFGVPVEGLTREQAEALGPMTDFQAKKAATRLDFAAKTGEDPRQPIKEMVASNSARIQEERERDRAQEDLNMSVTRSNLRGAKLNQEKAEIDLQNARRAAENVPFEERQSTIQGHLESGLTPPQLLYSETLTRKEFEEISEKLVLYQAQMSRAQLGGRTGLTPNQEVQERRKLEANLFNAHEMTGAMVTMGVDLNKNKAFQQSGLMEAFSKGVSPATYSQIKNIWNEAAPEMKWDRWEAIEDQMDLLRAAIVQVFSRGTVQDVMLAHSLSYTLSDILVASGGKADKINGAATQMVQWQAAYQKINAAVQMHLEQPDEGELP